MSEDLATPCNEGLLANLAALSNQVSSPVAPFPVFFSTGSCGGGAGVAIGSNFPLYYFPVNCPATGVPQTTDNCLRIIDNTDGHIGPNYNQTIPANQVNVLPNPNDSDNNIFNSPQERLYSWYVPYGYKMIFFHDDIRTTTVQAAMASKAYLLLPENTLVSDGCLSFLTLADGSTFFTYGTSSVFSNAYQPGNSTNVPCPLAYCAACSAQGDIPPGPYCNASSPVEKQDCPGVTHWAPYFLVLKEGSFSDLLLESCVKNRTITYGADPNNSLSKVWKPQSEACDNYITMLCNISDVSKSQYAELCSCFTQQQALNVQYGDQLEVPVCCFGTDGSGNPNKDCYFNSNAYKTGSVLANCCSFAECETLVEQNPNMQVKASPPGEIQCEGKFVQFPVPPTSPVGPLPTVIIENQSSIPFYTWIIFAIAIVLLVLFVFVLLFV